ncbi:MAG: hypothetical protein AAFV54_11015 [Pseudomonadota bacterium]
MRRNQPVLANSVATGVGNLGEALVVVDASAAILVSPFLFSKWS